MGDMLTQNFDNALCNRPLPEPADFFGVAPKKPTDLHYWKHKGQFRLEFVKMPDYRHKFLPAGAVPLLFYETPCLVEVGFLDISLNIRRNGSHLSVIERRDTPVAIHSKEFSFDLSPGCAFLPPRPCQSEQRLVPKSLMDYI